MKSLSQKFSLTKVLVVACLVNLNLTSTPPSGPSTPPPLPKLSDAQYSPEEQNVEIERSVWSDCVEKYALPVTGVLLLGSIIGNWYQSKSAKDKAKRYDYSLDIACKNIQRLDKYRCLAEEECEVRVRLAKGKYLNSLWNDYVEGNGRYYSRFCLIVDRLNLNFNDKNAIFYIWHARQSFIPLVLTHKDLQICLSFFDDLEIFNQNIDAFCKQEEELCSSYYEEPIHPLPEFNPCDDVETHDDQQKNMRQLIHSDRFDLLDKQRFNKSRREFHVEDNEETKDYIKSYCATIPLKRAVFKRLLNRLKNTGKFDKNEILDLSDSSNYDLSNVEEEKFYLLSKKILKERLYEDNPRKEIEDSVKWKYDKPPLFDRVVDKVKREIKLEKESFKDTIRFWSFFAMACVAFSVEGCMMCGRFILRPIRGY